MRLVNSKKDDAYLEVEEFNAENVPRYAILSHMWENDEVSFQEISKPQNAMVTKKGYGKIRQVCNIASANGLEHVWVDTCCIDKTSSAELSESINSMYRWYQDAEVCYAYLADVFPRNDLGGVEGHRISDSRWFQRGFTLQELIAPERVVFFDREWNELGTKEDLQDEISQRTNIPVRILSGRADLDDVCVAQRMSWAAGRQTKRLEDRAYSLMGIFGIHMPLLYGEGEMAFIRLQEEIIKILDDYSIFAWKSDQSSYGGLLASSPDAFQDSGNLTLEDTPFISGKSPWTITNKGIHLDLPYLGVGPRGLGLAILPCGKLGSDILAAIYLRDISFTMEQFERVGCDILEFVNLTRLQTTQYPIRRICVQQRRVALKSRRRHDANTAMYNKGGATNGTEETTLVSWALRTLSVAPQGLGKNSRAPCDFALEGDVIERSPVAQKDLLLHAAATGDTTQARSCLARLNVKVNVTDRAGETALSHAAKHGHIDVVWLLISRTDTILHHRDKSGMTPLLHATIQGHAAVVQMLLARLESPSPLVDGSGRTALSHAAEWGHHAVMTFILASNKLDPNQESDISQLPLFQAVKNGHEAAARLLLSHGAHVETEDDSSKTALHLVASHGSVAIARLLIDYGADVNAVDFSAKTPMHFAVMNRHTAIVRLLVAKGAIMAPRYGSGKKTLDSARGEFDQHVSGQLLTSGSHHEGLRHRSIFSQTLFSGRTRN